MATDEQLIENMRHWEGLRGTSMTPQECNAYRLRFRDYGDAELAALRDVQEQVCANYRRPRVADLIAAAREGPGRGRSIETRVSAGQRLSVRQRVIDRLTAVACQRLPGKPLRLVEFVLNKGHVEYTVRAPDPLGQDEDPPWAVYVHDPNARVPSGAVVGMDVRAANLNAACGDEDFWEGVASGRVPVDVVSLEFDSVRRRAERRVAAMVAQGTLRGAP